MHLGARRNLLPVSGEISVSYVTQRNPRMLYLGESEGVIERAVQG